MLSYSFGFEVLGVDCQPKFIEAANKKNQVALLEIEIQLKQERMKEEGTMNSCYW